MGKLKKISPKKVDNKQSKISLFFQAPKDASAKASAEKESTLFTTVNQSSKPKSRLALKKDNRNVPSASSRHSGAIQTVVTKQPNIGSKDGSTGQSEKAGGNLEPVAKKAQSIVSDSDNSKKESTKPTDSLKKFPLKFATDPVYKKVDTNEDENKTGPKDVKSVLLQASQIIKSLTGGVEDLEPPTVDDNQVTCIPETQFDDLFESPPPAAGKTEKRISDAAESDSELDSSIIPDTPQEKNIAGKKKTFRSFLTCTSALSSTNTLHNKLKQNERAKPKAPPPPKQQKPPTRSLEDALKSVENDLEFASAESFNAMLTGVGFGQGPIIPKKEVHQKADIETSEKQKHRAGAVGCLSGAKRLSATGASPNAKRVMRKTPVKRLSSKQKFDSENTNSKSNKVRKFSRNLFSSFSKKIIATQNNFPNDTAEKNVNLEGDDDLSDLLQSYQTDHVSPTPKSQTSSGKNKSSRELVKTCLSPIIPSHDEPDEMLDDIISELRDTLTQSNSKSDHFKAKLERSILSEGVSPRPLQAVKRRIPMDQDRTPTTTKYGKSKAESDMDMEEEMDVASDKNRFESLMNNKENMNRKENCDSLENVATVDKPMLAAAPEQADKNVGMDSGLCDDLDMSDLQFDEAELAMEEKLQQEFSALSPFKQEKSKGETGFSPEDAQTPCVHFGRCRVKEVVKEGADILLELLTDPGGEQRWARLQGFWTDVEVAEGSVIHIVGEFDAAGRITLSDKQNLLIVHPDLLVSGTSVVSGIHCMRRAVLNERFKGYDSKNIHMLYGTIIHSFFQQVVQKRRFTVDALEAAMQSVLEQPRVLHDMYGQGVTLGAVVEEIKKYVPQLQIWAERYLPAPGKAKSDNALTIMRIADIEENVWSPRYGIKGKIDLTVEVKIHDRQKGTSTKLMPLELKTGRPTHSVEHKGQVTLYSMMSGDRRADPEAGLLLYLKDGSMTNVPADHAHKRGLVQLRNEMAHHMWQSTVAESGSGMPRPINSVRSCTKCPQLINCAAYQRVLGEPEVTPEHAMSRLVPETLAHLSDSHLEFYRHWVRLMMLELGTGSKTGTAVADLWCKTGWQREKHGLCLSGMVLKPTREGCQKTETGHYRQTFTRLQSHPSAVQLNEVGITARDNLVVSAENEPLIALTMGGVTAITDTTITLLLDRDLGVTDPSGHLVYRLDKADTYNTMATNMTNLARLMEHTDTSARLRDIVIEKKTPEFEVTMSKGVIEKVRGIFKQLNKPQKTAILKVLMCKDYVLIKGYPGTGKTSTIVSLVRVLVLLGRSVLLTSYTHSAVDNILLKLIKYDLDFVRLGRAERIHPNVQPYSAELQTLRIKTVDELAQFYESKPIVATTCLGVGSHPIFTRRIFDVCIVDEASQVLQPACLGPLFASRRFVLVGDPLQLPPVVQSHKAREGGMDQSLFARLDGAGGTYELNLQYRMNADIMRLSNELVYKGALRCGSNAVAEGRLVLSNDNVLQSAPAWLQEALNPDNRIIFLDTSKIPVPDVKEKTGNVENQTEADIVRLIVSTCVQGGVDQDDVGVITPYRSQVALLHDLLQRHRLGGVEVNTVDQYQGRDKNCIIVSFVKNTAGKAGGILEDLRRLNVALTRACHKMVLIGHSEVLRNYEPLRAVLDILTFNQFLQLPEDAATSLSAT